MNKAVEPGIRLEKPEESIPPSKTLPRPVRIASCEGVIVWALETPDGTLYITRSVTGGGAAVGVSTVLAPKAEVKEPKLEDIPSFLKRDLK